MKAWFKQHHTAIIITVVIVLALAVAFFLTGKPSDNRSSTGERTSQPSVASQPASSKADSPSVPAHSEDSSQPSAASFDNTFREPDSQVPAEISHSGASVPVSKVPLSEAPQPSMADVSPQPSQTVSVPETVSPEPEESPTPVSASSAPESTPPASIESREESSRETVGSRCTISISCSLLLDHLEDLRKNKRQLVSSDGIILDSTETAFEEGESVFDVTKRICREKGIPFEFTMTPVYQTAYIEGIYNLYEFDCGSGSGWVYAVNQELPGVGCSDCRLHDGDRIEWIYSCNLGHDAEALIKERQT